jgi:glutathione S-transferase
MSSDVRYELYYWPSIQGRGEFVRLAFEDAGVPYVDVARLSESEGGGVRTMLRVMKDAAHEPFAPPFLRVGELTIAQTANILAFLGPKLELVPDDEPSRVWANQLQLTIADLAGEAHDTHHPISVGLYYEDQKPEARKRSESFVKERMPKYLKYFERALARGDGEHLVGRQTSYVDLSAFQLLTALGYAFPKAWARLEPELPHLTRLRDRVAQRPRLAAYLGSARRLPFNEDGLFRHYPELDLSD